MTDEMALIDVTGKAHPISKRSTHWILVAGWIFFVVSFVFHFIFYKIHPSGTDISLGAIKRRLLCGAERGWSNNEERGGMEGAIQRRLLCGEEGEWPDNERRWRERRRRMEDNEEEDFGIEVEEDFWSKFKEDSWSEFKEDSWSEFKEDSGSEVEEDEEEWSKRTFLEKLISKKGSQGKINKKKPLIETL